MKLGGFFVRGLRSAVALAGVALLALSLMVTGVSVTAPSLRAEAAGTGSITINNAVVGSTYTAYRLFDATLAIEEDSDEDSEDSDEESEDDSEESSEESSFRIAYQATAAQKEYYESIEGNVFLFTATTLSDVYVVSVVEGYSESDVTSFIRSLVLDGTMDDMVEEGLVQLVTSVTAEDTTVVLSNLPYGYYYVTSSLGTLIAVTSTTPDVEAEEKNDAPSLEKEVSSNPDGPYSESNEASVGDRVFFRITIEATPGAAGYVLHDELSPGLTLEVESIVVTADGETLTEGEEYTLYLTRELLRPGMEYGETEDDCTFEIVFDEDWLDTIDQNITILITYSAIVNEDAVVGTPGNLNSATLDYGSDYTWSTEPEETITIVPPTPPEEPGGGDGDGGGDGGDTPEEEVPEEELTEETEETDLLSLIEAGGTLSTATVEATASGEILPQTGQLNWPIPILATLGMLLFLTGFVINKGGKKEEG